MVSMKELVLGLLQVTPVLGILYGAVVAGSAKDDSGQKAGAAIMAMSAVILLLLVL
jgi:hypothetical protein